MSKRFIDFHDPSHDCDHALEVKLDDLDGFCRELAENPPRPSPPTPAEMHGNIERMFEGVYQQLDIAFVPSLFMASKTEDLVLAPNARPMPSLAEGRAYANKHDVPLHQALNELYDASRVPPKTMPALDALGDLQTAGEPPTAVRHSENRRPRRSVARDQRSAKATAPYYEEELRKRGRALVPNPPSSKTPFKTSQSTTTPSPYANENVPAWKEAKAYGKLVAMNRAITMNDNGDACAFTLNLSPDVIARGLASRHSGFAAWLQKRIASELGKALVYPVPFVFAVDVTRDGRPHLHGVVACNDNDRPIIETAFRRAGGSWKAAHAHRQVDTRPVWNADGWTSYTARKLAAARKVVGRSVIAGTAGLKAEAKALYERLRRQSLAGP